MQTQLTVRIPEDLGESITELAKRAHLKRSHIVRLALEKYLEQVRQEDVSTPYDRVKDLIGVVASGISDLGEAHRKHLLKKIAKSA